MGSFGVAVGAGAAGSGFCVGGGGGGGGGGGLIFVLRGISAGVAGGAERWVIILCGLDIFLMFPNFLRS